MNKYIDADKLLAEIERRKKQDITFRERNILVDIETCISSLRADMIITSLQQPKFKVGDTIHKKGENTVFPMTIERISDGDYVCNGGKCFVSIKFQDNYELIQQEQPDNEDIDKVAQELYEHLYELKRRNNVPTNLYDKQEIIDLWKAGIEYGRNHPNQGQPDNMIQWTGNNLKEVIDFTGKSPRFGEWFKSWEEFENYVHTHNDILKLFCEDGSHYEVPVGAWIVKTPDGYNVPSVAKYIQHEQSKESVGVVESPLKTFPRINEFDCGSSYRH